MTVAKESIPRHVAIIMDGNGRWAQQRGFPRLRGHVEGTESVRRVIEAAIRHGVEYLSLYVFSTENWGRPQEEVDGLMELFCESVAAEGEALMRNGVRVRIIGDREGMPPKVREYLDAIERETVRCGKLELLLCLNYGAREEIVRAMREIAEEVKAGTMSAGGVDAETVAANLFTAGIPDPDLLIRTSGEQRLSNFLLWQAAYAELYFTEVLWPDFGEEEFAAALAEYAKRERRYGRLETPADI